MLTRKLTKKRTRKLTVLVAAAAALLALAGCGSNDTDPQTSTTTAANGDEFNDADVRFATDMIPHHAQALQMVDLTMGRSLDPQVASLTEDIRDAQAPEIQTMTDWLTAWDKPIPETPRDHANAGHDGTDGMGMSGDEMPGMMSSEELDELEAASDTEFQDMWLTMMIAHHEGAIEMAKTEQTDGTYQPAIDLAESIETSQQQEISHMQELLGS
jgi:uncharacterized protein (DUF305 family)